MPSLLLLTKSFPTEAVDEQVRKYARKPYKMGAKQFVILMSQNNNYIPFFPNAMVVLKYSEEELLGILELAVPPHWRKAFDLRDYLPINDNKARFISECERVERNEVPLAKEHDGSDDDHKRNRKLSMQNLRKVSQKVARKQIRSPVLCIEPTARRTPMSRSAAGTSLKK
jgi:hypothetical protein